MGGGMVDEWRDAGVEGWGWVEGWGMGRWVEGFKP